ncbi:MAG TPA: hypothetical protein VGI40_15705 [Pirellulaceae bacterium]|jgi:hypothetical protein
MSEYAIIFQVLGALAALFFIFLTYMSTKTWRWLHVTATFFVLAATIAFCVYAAMTLKTRANWIKLHDNLEKQLATTDTELEKVTQGDPKDVEGKEPSVLSLREELARIVIDRGRVWRGCLPVIDPRTGVIVVRTSPPENPENPAAAGAKKKNNIAAKTVLHVFREAQESPESPLVPASYIGEFKASAVTDDTVTLEATTPLAPEQIAAGRAQATWSLYEVCPVDGHEWFEGSDDERRKPLTNAAGLDRVQLDPRLVNSYLRDGKEATDTDPPENVWYEVKFEQEYEVSVDAPIVSSLDTEPFNTEGQAVLARLRREKGNAEQSGKVVFGPKDGQISTAVLDKETAQSLIDKGIAIMVGQPIYRRKLTDYELAFHSINERLTEINGRVAQLKLDDAAMLASTQKAEQQRALVEELKAKVVADLERAKNDSAELEKYKNSLAAQVATVQNELSQLYRANKALGRELAQLSAQLTDEINRRTREATALTP